MHSSHAASRGELCKGSIRKLNNIRNSFSHQLKPQKYDEAIKDFVEMCVEDPHELSTKSSLVLAMYAIYNNLNELKI
jgi:hypothetical protein